MLKKIMMVLKKTCVAFLMLYSFNVIASGVGVYIPINFITTGAVFTLGLPGLLSLVAVFFITK